MSVLFKAVEGHRPTAPEPATRGDLIAMEQSVGGLLVTINVKTRHSIIESIFRSGLALDEEFFVV